MSDFLAVGTAQSAFAHPTSMNSLALNPSEQEQDQQDDDNEAEATAAIISGAIERSAPNATEAAEQRDNEYDKDNQSD
jgi:hypothetical protein